MRASATACRIASDIARRHENAVRIASQPILSRDRDDLGYEKPAQQFHEPRIDETGAWLQVIYYPREPSCFQPHRSCAYKARG